MQHLLAIGVEEENIGLRRSAPEEIGGRPVPDNDIHHRRIADDDVFHRSGQFDHGTLAKANSQEIAILLLADIKIARLGVVCRRDRQDHQGKDRCEGQCARGSTKEALGRQRIVKR